VIISDTSRLTLKDVCVGEVFLLGGQSNMVWTLAWSEDIHRNEIESATQENIRIMRLNHTESHYELADAEGDVAWSRVNPEVVKTFSAVGFMFGKRIQEELDVPVGLVQSAVSGSSLAFWLPRDAYNEYIASGKTAYSSTSSGNLIPCLGYNGMIAPLVGMRFRGMVWYQGETNTQDSAFYFDQLSLLIETYRENFNAPLMSVTVIELAKATADHALKWEPIKAAQQRAAAEIENVALSVSIDLGYHVDVHPRDKTMFAKRAAEITLNKFFGVEISPFPTVTDACRIYDNMVALTLSGGSEFLLKNGANGFEVSVDGKTFVPATGALIDGNTLNILSNETINYVRYGVIYYDGETDFTKHVTVYNAEGNPLDQFTIKID
jgi:sialate O-acetylesterase